MKQVRINNQGKNRFLFIIFFVILMTIIACSAKKGSNTAPSEPSNEYRAHELYYGAADNAINARRATIATEMQVVSQMLESKITVTPEDVIRMMETGAGDYALAAPSGFSFRSQRTEIVHNGEVVSRSDSQATAGDGGAASAVVPPVPVVKEAPAKRSNLFDTDPEPEPKPTPKKNYPLNKKDRNMMKLPGLKPGEEK